MRNTDHRTAVQGEGRSKRGYKMKSKNKRKKKAKANFEAMNKSEDGQKFFDSLTHQEKMDIEFFKKQGTLK